MLGAVLVGPRASESVFPLALAITHRHSVDQIADVITVYPSLSGSLAEVARTLHHRAAD